MQLFRLLYSLLALCFLTVPLAQRCEANQMSQMTQPLHQHPPPPLPDLLFGNISLHRASSGNNEEVGVCPEAGNVIHLDYSLQFNSVVAVCDSKNNGTVNIFPLDKSQPAKLLANGLALTTLKTPHTSFFALDWSTGLLYFTSGNEILVADLKKPLLDARPNGKNAEFERHVLKVYDSTREIVIQGLVVRPDRSSLIWMEDSKEGVHRITIRQASQAGRNVTSLHQSIGQLEDLTYDYLSDRFLAVGYHDEASKHRVYLFHLANLSDGTSLRSNEVVVEGKWTKGNRFLLYGDSVVFLDHDGHGHRMSVRRWNVSLGGLEPTDLLPEQASHAFAGHAFALVDNGNHHFVHPQVEGDRCGVDPTAPLGVPCSGVNDFCVPHNATHYMCKLDSQLRKVIRARWPRWAIITTAISVSVLAVLLAAVVGWVLTKKRMKFYQIKLKSMNRVNSSKLQVKSEATEEVAE